MLTCKSDGRTAIFPLAPTWQELPPAHYRCSGGRRVQPPCSRARRPFAQWQSSKPCNVIRKTQARPVPMSAASSAPSRETAGGRTLTRFRASVQCSSIGQVPGPFPPQRPHKWDRCPRRSFLFGVDGRNRKDGGWRNRGHAGRNHGVDHCALVGQLLLPLDEKRNNGGLAGFAPIPRTRGKQLFG